MLTSRSPVAVIRTTDPRNCRHVPAHLMSAGRLEFGNPPNSEAGNLGVIMYCNSDMVVHSTGEVFGSAQEFDKRQAGAGFVDVVLLGTLAVCETTI